MDNKHDQIDACEFVMREWFRRVDHDALGVTYRRFSGGVSLSTAPRRPTLARAMLAAVQMDISDAIYLGSRRLIKRFESARDVVCKAVEPPRGIRPWTTDQERRVKDHRFDDLMEMTPDEQNAYLDAGGKF